MRIRRFGHAGIMVGDLGAAEAFYREVLGLSVAARYPDDDEVMLAVGQGDHLLLKSKGAEARDARGDVSGGLHHVAFELVEGHREIAKVTERLTTLGIPFQAVDHGGDGAIYFRDADGNLLEVYTAPGTSPRFTSEAERLDAAKRFVYANARALDRAIFDRLYLGGHAERVLAALDVYRNADGGFGHALEPDVRAPSSQTIHTLTALELLRDAQVRAPQVADGCCDFLASIADPEGALPALLPDALDHPAAAHWQGPFSTEPRLGWTFALVAELSWHGARHPWFQRARDVCLAAVDDFHSEEAHELLYLMRFAGRVLDGDRGDCELARRYEALERAAFFAAGTPVSRYGLTPLHYAPSPDTPARRCFDDALIEAHLDDLLDAQQADGGWPIRFEPPSEAAVLEWRGRWTLDALSVLRAYGRLRP